MTGLTSSPGAPLELGLVGQLDHLSESLDTYFNSPSLSLCEPDRAPPKDRMGTSPRRNT